MTGNISYTTFCNPLDNRLRDSVLILTNNDKLNLINNNDSILHSSIKISFLLLFR